MQPRKAKDHYNDGYKDGWDDSGSFHRSRMGELWLFVVVFLGLVVVLLIANVVQSGEIL